ncbi:MAG TPA: imidazole glycerol phosphate synthase subunit HisH [Chitinophagales bacterium]|nr:imidazole glycerol phosphate synthase subunit HisH [Chitinophagales bacterium]
MNSQKIVIVRYNGGNIQSVEDALKRLGVQAIVTDKPDEILSADKVIFPGVGEAKSAMAYLKERELDKVLKSIHQPFLGICLGQQLMCSHSEEGDVECLGIFEERVKKFLPIGSGLKVPHMGWNSIYNLKGDLYQGIEDNSYVYFVHSYFVEVGKDTVATCNYIHPFTASLQRDNYYSCQFHPEKSADIGSQVLSNFIKL